MTPEPSTAGLDAGAANGPRLLLAEHHREIEAACTALLARTYADDPRELIAQYKLFERAIVEHLDGEEQLILPAYSAEAPADAQAILAEHGAIRHALNRIGIEVELHLVRARSVHALVDLLRKHAEREDESMYPWAQLHLTVTAKGQLFDRIADSMRALLKFRTRGASVTTPEPRPPA